VRGAKNRVPRGLLLPAGLRSARAVPCGHGEQLRGRGGPLLVRYLRRGLVRPRRGNFMYAVRRWHSELGKRRHLCFCVRALRGWHIVGCGCLRLQRLRRGILRPSVVGGLHAVPRGLL
jgi:hypothetical protein